MPRVEFVTQSANDTDNRATNTERLINCYPQEVGGRSRLVIKSVPGVADQVLTGGLFVQAMRQVKTRLMIVAGGTLQAMKENRVLQARGEVLASDETTISSLDDQTLVAAGGNYYVADNGRDAEEVVPTAFTAVGSVLSTAQRVILTERGGRRIAWSDLADPRTFDALQFATAEGEASSILRGAVIAGNPWFFKERSIEVWQPVTDSRVFARLSGGVIDRGLKAFGLLSEFETGVFFVGDDNIAYVTSGAGLQRVSTRPVETAIEQGTPDRCFYYEDEGHKFLVIRFRDRPAWAYDLTTQVWHERASDVDLRPWDMLTAARAFGNWYGGDLNGSIYRFDRTNTDIRYPLKRVAVSRTWDQEGMWFGNPRTEFYAQGEAMALEDLAAGVVDASGSNAQQDADVVFQVNALDLPAGDEEQQNQSCSFAEFFRPGGVGDDYTWADVREVDGANAFSQDYERAANDGSTAEACWSTNTNEDSMAEIVGAEYFTLECYGFNVYAPPTSGISTPLFGTWRQFDNLYYLRLVWDTTVSPNTAELQFVYNDASDPTNTVTVTSEGFGYQANRYLCAAVEFDAVNGYIGLYGAQQDWQGASVTLPRIGVVQDTVVPFDSISLGNLPFATALFGSNGQPTNSVLMRGHFRGIRVTTEQDQQQSGQFIGSQFSTNCSAVEAEGGIAQDDLDRYISRYRPAQMMIERSNDYGRTWGTPQRRSIGDVGEHDNRIILRRGGRARQLTFRVSMTDPTEIALHNTADLDIV